ncbi:MAG: hypothetical protein AB7L90_21780 [Hyphomicrobiaceae bacterium]
MLVDWMFWLAVAAFAWGLSLASYRWFAVHNGWPMGEWQAHRPGLPIAIGLFSILFATLFAVARGGTSIYYLPLLGVFGALAWTAVLRVAAQSALLLAPLSTIALIVLWMTAVSHFPVAEATFYRPDGSIVGGTAATDREADIAARDRGMTATEQRGGPSPLSRR